MKFKHIVVLNSMVLEKHNTISASLVNATMSLNLIGEPNGQHQKNYMFFP